MRICQVINIGQEVGGAEKCVHLLTDGLRARGHQVAVLSTDHRLDPAASFADYVVPAAAGNALARLSGFFWNHAAYRGVRRALAEFRPDVVHLHTIGMFSPSVLSATKDHPRLLTVHGPEDWTLRMLSWNLHSRSQGDGTLSVADRARYAYLRYLQRPAYLPRVRQVDRILVPSRFYADALRCDVGRVPVHVLPNGIPLPARTPVPDRPRLLYVGRHERVKGADVLVEAFLRVEDRHPGAELVMVGDGPLRAELTDRVAASGSAQITITGRISDAELALQYDRSSVVVIPSVLPDNLPTVAIEALGVGRALVGSRTGGIPELVLDGENGLLAEPGDVDELAAVLDRILGDPALRLRMGARSAELAGNYSMERFLDQLEEHYTALVDAPRHRSIAAGQRP